MIDDIEFEKNLEEYDRKKLEEELEIKLKKEFEEQQDLEEKKKEELHNKEKLKRHNELVGELKLSSKSIISAIKKETDKLDTKIDLKPIIRAIEDIEFPAMPKQVDYSGLLKDIKDSLPNEVDLSNVERLLKGIVPFEIPEELISADGRLRVEVDRTGGGGGGGYSSVGIQNASDLRINPNTEDFEKDKLHHYKLTDFDDSDTQYIAYMDKEGKWYVMKISPYGEVTYCKGDSGYVWNDRTILTYDTFNNIF